MEKTKDTKKMAAISEELLSLNEAICKELKTAVNDLQDKKKKEVVALSVIADNLNAQNVEGAAKDIKVYLTAAEKNFIQGKSLIFFSNYERRLTRPFEKLTDIQQAQRFGTSEWFSPTLTPNKHVMGYTFHLPTMASKKTAERSIGDGRYIHHLVQRLLQDYEKGNKLETLFHPIVVFEHHINVNDKLDKVLDADNVDTKTALDGLFGYLVADDNLIAMSLLHIGVPDDESFCNMHVFESDYFPVWVQKNTHLFIGKEA